MCLKYKFFDKIAYAFGQNGFFNFSGLTKDLIHLVKLPSVKNIHPCKWSIRCQLCPEVVQGIYRRYMKLQYKSDVLICHFQDFQWMVIFITTAIKCKASYLIWMQSGIITLIKVWKNIELCSFFILIMFKTIIVPIIVLQ